MENNEIRLPDVTGCTTNDEKDRIEQVNLFVLYVVKIVFLDMQIMCYQIVGIM